MTSEVIYPAFVETDDDKSAYRKAVDGGWAEWVLNRSDILAIKQGCKFSMKRALRPKQFIESSCFLTPGKPFILFDWQWRRVVAPLYGWIQPDGFGKWKRRFQRGLVVIPKKNGKSVLCAALSLYSLCATGEYSAQAYVVACTRDQAGELYREIVKMIRNSPVLRQKLEVKESIKRVLYRKVASSIQTLSSDAGSSQGINASFLCMDELHSWSPTKGRALWGSLRYAGAGRAEPLAVAITTAGDRRTGVAWEQYRYGKDVAAGKYDDTSYYSFYAEAEDTDDIYDPAVWIKANPSFGFGQRTEESFRKEAEASKVSISAEVEFRRYRLNQWVASGEKGGWIRHATWKAAKARRPLEECLGQPCWAGLDLSTVHDVTALVVLFPHDDGTFSAFSHFYVPGDTALEREKRQEAPYQTWINRGIITATEGNAIDYDFLRVEINRLADLYKWSKLAIDAKFQGNQLAMQLESTDGLAVRRAEQGIMAMTGPAKRFEHMVRKGDFRHGNNEMLDWMLSNVVLKVDSGGNYKPDKARSKDKVDGIFATLMALNAYDKDEQDKPVLITEEDLQFM